jgi:hypothetical protein
MAQIGPGGDVFRRLAGLAIVAGSEATGTNGLWRGYLNLLHPFAVFLGVQGIFALAIAP